jgi:hypothetical protein
MASTKPDDETIDVRVAPNQEAIATLLPTDDAFESRAADPTLPAGTSSFSTLPLSTPSLSVIKSFEDADSGESITLLLATPQQAEHEQEGVEQYEHVPKLEDFSPMAMSKARLIDAVADFWMSGDSLPLQAKLVQLAYAAKQFPLGQTLKCTLIDRPIGEGYEFQDQRLDDALTQLLNRIAAWAGVTMDSLVSHFQKEPHADGRIHFEGLVRLPPREALPKKFLSACSALGLDPYARIAGMSSVEWQRLTNNRTDRAAYIGIARSRGAISYAFKDDYIATDRGLTYDKNGELRWEWIRRLAANSDIAPYETRRLRYQAPRKTHRGRPARESDLARYVLEQLVERRILDGDFIAKVRDMYTRGGWFSKATWQRELLRANLRIRDNRAPNQRGKLREGFHKLSSPPGLTMRRLYV